MSKAVPPPCSEDGLPEPPPMTEEQVALIGKALGHPARIRILEEFNACIPHLAGDLSDAADLAQSTVSEHLRILREADVLFTRRDGPRSWYCVRRSVLRAYAEAMARLALAPLERND